MRTKRKPSGGNQRAQSVHSGSVSVNGSKIAQRGSLAILAVRLPVGQLDALNALYWRLWRASVRVAVERFFVQGLPPYTNRGVKNAV